MIILTIYLRVLVCHDLIQSYPIQLAKEGFSMPLSMGARIAKQMKLVFRTYKRGWLTPSSLLSIKLPIIIKYLI